MPYVSMPLALMLPLLVLQAAGLICVASGALFLGLAKSTFNRVE
jgi:hypothetical protein